MAPSRATSCRARTGPVRSRQYDAPSRARSLVGSSPCHDLAWPERLSHPSTCPTHPRPHAPRLNDIPTHATPEQFRSIRLKPQRLALSCTVLERVETGPIVSVHATSVRHASSCHEPDRPSRLFIARQVKPTVQFHTRPVLHQADYSCRFESSLFYSDRRPTPLHVDPHLSWNDLPASRREHSWSCLARSDMSIHTSTVSTLFLTTCQFLSARASSFRLACRMSNRL